MASPKTLGFGAVTVVVCSIVIGLAWYLHEVSQTDYNGFAGDARLCKSSPFEYARPFYARSNDGSEDIYCGYSIGNTVYRSVIAGVSIIIAFVSMAGVLESMPKFNYWLTYFLTMGWIGAVTADCTVCYMAFGVCREYFSGGYAEAQDLDGKYQCSSSRYGLALAFDFLMAAVMLGMLFTSSPAPKDT